MITPMSVEVTYPHITKITGESAYLSRLPRIRVAQIVMDWLAHGWSADEICRQHPHLHPAEVHAAMAYYYDHSEEIDSEILAEATALRASAAAESRFRATMKAKGLI
jgi:hypothetical protein